MVLLHAGYRRRPDNEKVWPIIFTSPRVMQIASVITLNPLRLISGQQLPIDGLANFLRIN
jgi:hypothetical protein